MGGGGVWGWYPSMHCRSPCPNPGGEVEGSGLGGVSRPTTGRRVSRPTPRRGVSRPTPRVGLQAHTWGVSRPTPGAVSQHALRQAPPPPPHSRWLRILVECILVHNTRTLLQCCNDLKLLGVRLCA